MRIYLDHNATTPLREEVLAAMTRALRDAFGNPSSVHADGARARREIERARERVAGLVGVRSGEIVFTSGATEANNLALQGIARAGRAHGRHLVASAIEHPSIEEPLEALRAEGWRVTRVPAGADGRVDPDAVDAALAPDTTLVSVQWANHETGAIQPIEPVAALARARGIALHVDATQAIGRISTRLDALPIDALSASAHKFNGPKGVGFLVLRGDLAIEPWLRGGAQERGRRAGTQNVPGIVGLGVAAELAARELAERAERYSALRDRLWDGIESKIAGVRRNAGPPHVLPNTLNVEFEDAPGDVLLEALDGEGVSVSFGAACASGALRPSATLLAMGRTLAQARCALRMSVGLGVDEAQIDRVLALLPELVERVRRAAGA